MADPIRRTRSLGTISTSAQRKNNATGEVISSKSNTDHVPVENVGDHPGYVMIKGGVTRNMENYESINVQVSIGMPCVATIDAAKKKYEEISVVVDELVTKEMRMAMNGEEAPQNV